MGKNIFYFIIALAVLALVGGAIFMVTQQSTQKAQRSLTPVEQQEEEEEQGLGSQLSQNPGSEVPDTNPFGGKTNPFEGYTNPFE